MKITRRNLLLGATAAATILRAAESRIIDVHQHTNYDDRSDDDLIAHQKQMGITRTVLLPAGSRFGLAVKAGGNESVLALARRLPNSFTFFANEVPDLPEASQVIEKYLKLGAIGIGEQKFQVEADSIYIQKLAEVAQHYQVPMLLHFQHQTYNLGFDRFYRILERYPTVNFIGHAQTWWGNIDKDLRQEDLYPKTRVMAGGITDRYLRDYPNMYGDMSAGSGLNAMLRDKEHARAFLKRHQDKLLYGSDCDDRLGFSDKCSGSQCIRAIRELADADVADKIFFRNAAKLLRI
jgi:predicted TIM-barrel fold metal-dependent hydrolase